MSVFLIVVAVIAVVWIVLAVVTRVVCKKDEKLRAAMSEDERRAADLRDYKQNQLTHT